MVTLVTVLYVTCCCWSIAPTVSGDMSSLIYYEGNPATNISVLHRLEISQTCDSCPGNCERSCFHDNSINFDPQDVHISALDFLHEEEKIYFFNAIDHSIENIQYSSSSRKVALRLNSSKVNGIAIDWLGKNLYYTDDDSKAVILTSLRRKFQRVLVTNLTRPHSIAVDPLRGHVCWTTLSVSSVECLHIGHMTRAKISRSAIEEPNSVTFDHVTGRVWWVDTGKGTIESAQPDGTEYEEKKKFDGSRMHGIVYLQGLVITLDWTGRRLRFWNMTSHQGRTVNIGMARQDSLRLAFYDRRLQAEKSLCSDSSCPGGVCLMNGSSDVMCLCPGQELPQPRSCIEESSKMRQDILVGTVCGVLATILIILVIVSVCCCYHRYKRTDAQNSVSPAGKPQTPPQVTSAEYHDLDPNCCRTGHEYMEII